MSFIVFYNVNSKLNIYIFKKIARFLTLFKLYYKVHIKSIHIKKHILKIAKGISIRQND